MNLNPLHIWASMGPLSKFITGLLLLMAALSIAVFVERLLALVRWNRSTAQFRSSAAPMLETHNFEALRKVAQDHLESPLARLIHPIVGKFLKGGAEEAHLAPTELARRECERQKESMAADIRRGMGILASVGSIAPFVGLLGTVVGIITAFQGIAATGSGGLGSVSAGIAEALVETALGLMVAIPAVLLFNFLTTRMNSVEMTLGQSLSELLDEMENAHGHRRHTRIFERKETVVATA